MLAPLALTLALAPTPGSVEFDRETWQRLHPPAPAELVVPAWAAVRGVTLEPVAGGVQLRARWTLRSLSRGAWFSGQVLGDIPGMRVERVTWDGQPVATATRPAGVTVAGRVDGKATLELVAFIPGEPTREPLALTLLPAVRGHVEAAAPAGLVPTLGAIGPPPPASPLKTDEPSAPVTAGPSSALTPVTVDETDASPVPSPIKTDESLPAPVPIKTDALRMGPVFWTGAARLDLAYVAAPSAPASRATVVVARAGVGLTIGDAELRGRARLVWEVRQGSLDAVAFTVADVGPDLEIKGAGVRAVQRSGEGVRVDLQAPVAGRLELDATWTAPVAKSAESRAAIPRFTFTDVFRSESTLQIARDGEVEAVPTTADMTPTSAATLPVWGQGLVEGTPTAAFRGGASPSGHLDLLRFVPLEGPPVVVDVAAYTIATSREGRALIRAHYEVRNERAASLRVRPPPGFEVLGVRVGGETATPARDRDGAYRVPLQRSVETVSGLLSFPVEIAFLGGEGDWRRRERRALTLPQLDAPVAVARVTVHLPPGYRSRVKPGDGDVVPAFTRGEGITYGLGVGAVGAAEADAVFQSAVKNWLGNDFAAAQADLDRLKSMGASNENITRLQGNLDVIAGRGAKDEGNAGRRIREQAKARSIADQQLQDELRTKAEEARKSGDYEAAQSQYQAAIEVGDRLAKLEQKESVEQDVRNTYIQQEALSNVAEFKAVKKRSAASKERRKSRSFGKGSFNDAYQDSDGDTGVVDTRTTAKPAPDPAKPEPIVDLPTPARDFTAVVDMVPGAVDDTGKHGKRGQATVTKTDEAERPAPDKPGDVQVRGATVSETTYIVDGIHTAQQTPATTAEPQPAPPAGGPTNVATGSEATTDVAVSQRSLEIMPVASRQSVTQRLAGVARGRYRLGDRLRSRRDNAKPTAAAPPPQTAAPPPTPGPTGSVEDDRKVAEKEQPKEPPGLAGLPAPVVTASAVSVVVPQVGQAVLYQRLLLPADAVHAIDISAREPLLRREAP